MSFWKKQPNEKNSEQQNEGSLGFAKRVEHFFSMEPQKEKVLQREDFYTAGDTYYAQISALYKVAGRFLWLFFICFMVISIIANYNSITYDNFFYLIKDFSSAADTEGTNYETLSYESDTQQKFTLYRGGIASVSPSQISVFTPTGRRTLRTASSFSAPFLISSKKYILIYDTSGKQVSLYNSFARIHTEAYEYPVYDACLGDDGSFAVATRTAERASAVYIYDSSFSFAGGIESDLYVFDLAMRRDRNALTILSYDMGNGTGKTVLSVRNLNTRKETDKLTFEGEFPLGCVFLEKDIFAVVTDHCIRIFDRNFSLLRSSEIYDAKSITAYSITEEGIAVALSGSSSNQLIAFDKDGNLLYNRSVRLNVSDVGVYDRMLFVQSESGITRIDTNGNEEKFLPSAQGKMLIYNKSTALVCGSSKAEYLIF